MQGLQQIESLHLIHVVNHGIALTSQYAAADCEKNFRAAAECRRKDRRFDAESAYVRDSDQLFLHRELQHDASGAKRQEKDKLKALLRKVYRHDLLEEISLVVYLPNS